MMYKPHTKEINKISNRAWIAIIITKQKAASNFWKALSPIRNGSDDIGYFKMVNQTNL